MLDDYLQNLVTHTRCALQKKDTLDRLTHNEIFLQKINTNTMDRENCILNQDGLLNHTTAKQGMPPENAK